MLDKGTIVIGAMLSRDHLHLHIKLFTLPLYAHIPHSVGVVQSVMHTGKLAIVFLNGSYFQIMDPQR